MPTLVILLAALASACQSQPGLGRIDLRAYLERARSWATVEAEAARTVERILDTHFVDEAEVLRQIGDSRPRIQGHLERVQAYAPRSEEVQRIHQHYVQAWQKLLGAYDAIERGFASGDHTLLARGREGMGAWRESIIDVAQDLRQLVDHFGIDPSDAVQSRAPRPTALARSDRTTKVRSAARGGPDLRTRDPGGVLLSHTATVQYHRRWRA